MCYIRPFDPFADDYRPYQVGMPTPYVVPMSTDKSSLEALEREVKAQRLMIEGLRLKVEAQQDMIEILRDKQ